MKPIRRLMRKFLRTSVFAAQSFCLGAAFQSNMTDYTAFKQFASPESAYSFSSFKQFPVLFDGGNPVLPDDAFYRELRAAASEALRPETPAERLYEAYLWRESAEPVYLSLKKQAGEYDDFVATLNSEQIFLRDLMRADYVTLLQILKRMENDDISGAQALASFADFLAKEGTDVKFIDVRNALELLEKSMPEREDAPDADDGGAAENIDVLESDIGNAERALMDSERELEKGSFAPPDADAEILDFFN